jgi:hypothetical protein
MLDWRGSIVVQFSIDFFARLLDLVLRMRSMLVTVKDLFLNHRGAESAEAITVVTYLTKICDDKS